MAPRPILTHIMWVPMKLHPVQTDVTWQHFLVDEATVAAYEGQGGFEQFSRISDEDRLLPLVALPYVYPRAGAISIRGQIERDEVWLAFWRSIRDEVSAQGGKDGLTTMLAAVLIELRAEKMTDVRSLRDRIAALLSFAKRIGSPADEILTQYSDFAYRSTSRPQNESGQTDSPLRKSPEVERNEATALVKTALALFEGDLAGLEWKRATRQWCGLAKIHLNNLS